MGKIEVRSGAEAVRTSRDLGDVITNVHRLASAMTKTPLHFVIENLPDEVLRVTLRDGSGEVIDDLSALADDYQRLLPEDFEAKVLGASAPGGFSTWTRTVGADAAPLGPNGYRVSYLENGDLVEWVPSDDEPGEDVPMVLRRGDPSIIAVRNELWDIVWWYRMVVRNEQIRRGDPDVAGEKPVQIRGTRSAKVVEAKFGRTDMRWSDFEWGMLQGKLSALAWVLGSDWEGSLDT